ncbi:aminoglycoside phosphotransferase family protein [Microlunatus parietis]|uniref:Aminoglycoside phosphotransferase (APT) family kinase protein n=1 Tax=Microlunatus parietis TaxID=682979 RepID=A0A7Y9LG74_9ACTN|nr:aminoglycoside phosphotransferase family protein [Microlunatus parietis]NYE75568.1 aminoglycoside phosphotransferase (APT) family kinase protein [Microlunatus parietis]
MGNPFEGHQRTDDPAPAALRAAVGLGRELGLTVTEPEVLSDGFWLMVHLRPAPVVARVATFTARMRDPESSLGRELAVTGYLAGQGAPVVGPSPLLPARPYHHEGHWIGFWEYAERRPDAPAPTLEDCLALIGPLHDQLAGYPGPLEPFGSVNQDLAYCLDRLDRAADLLGSAGERALRTAAERLRDFRLAPPSPLLPVHGDLHPGNMINTPEGVRWLDFEDVGLAPREWDLALLSWYVDEPQLASLGPDPERLALCRDLRALQILAGLIAFRGVLGSGPDYDAMITGALPLLTETRALAQ